jgi:hypothetical protein
MLENTLSLVPDTHSRPASHIRKAKSEFDFSIKPFTKDVNCILLPFLPDPAADFNMVGCHLGRFYDRFSVAGKPGTFNKRDVMKLCSALPRAGRLAADIVVNTMSRMERYDADDVYLFVKLARHHRQRGRIHVDLTDKDAGNLLCCFNTHRSKVAGMTEGWNNEDVIPSTEVPEIRMGIAEQYRKDIGRSPYAARGETKAFRNYLQAHFKMNGYYVPKPGAQPFPLVEPCSLARLAGQNAKRSCVHSEPPMAEDEPSRLVAVGDYYPFRAQRT